MKAKITNVERVLLDVPLKERPARNMNRQFWHWSVTEVCQVESDAGLVGYGETIPTYTWGKVSKEQIERVKGRSPFELLWDDSTKSLVEFEEHTQFKNIRQFSYDYILCAISDKTKVDKAKEYLFDIL